MNPDGDVLKALDYLYNAREMQIIRAWLREAGNNEAMKAIKATENVDVIRGRAQLAIELVELFETAPQLVQRLERRHGTKKSGEKWEP